MGSESIKKTVAIALGVSLVCSVLVSATVVSLESVRKKNEKRSTMERVIHDLDLAVKGESMEDIVKRTRVFLIELETGMIFPEARYTERLNPEDFDVKRMAHDPEYGMDIPDEKDLADIRRIPRYMIVYELTKDDKVDKYIFHVYGKGLYSTLYGVIALDDDLTTIEGISFYEHGETPGLGGEIDNPQWKKRWKGKKVFDDLGTLRIEVIKGQVDKEKTGAQYQIDGLTGATFTTRGVNHLVRFWFGEDGYGPFLGNLRSGG